MTQFNSSSGRSVSPDPEFDLQMEGNSTVVKAIFDARNESLSARSSRSEKNDRNWDMYFGRQDFSAKIEGQSREFLPKTAAAAEQMSALFRKGLTQFGDWFRVKPTKYPQILTPEEVRDTIKLYLNDLPPAYGNAERTTFDVVLGDAVKNALFESLMIFKVHGEVGRKTVPTRNPEGRLQMQEIDAFRLRIDAIRPQDYYPDPTGRGLYEMTETEVDLFEVKEMASLGIYDPDAVAKLETGMEKDEEERRQDWKSNQNRASLQKNRKTVVITEYWGKILDEDGSVLFDNIVATVANYKYLIRAPEPNPFWHGKSPFVCCPLIRIPWSVWHKALYDDASALNIAINELFNLIFDGGLASVWGTRQVRPNHLQDPESISGGIPQGAALAVRDSLPPGAKVVETVTEGRVPPEALTILELANSEFSQASMTNELKLGALPKRNVLATEIIEQSQSQASTLDSLVKDVEQLCIEQILEKAWLTILQNLDWFGVNRIAEHVSPNAAVFLMQLDRQEAYAALAPHSSFTAFGLTSLVSQARDFTKIAAYLQIVQANPILMQAFFTVNDPFRVNESLQRTMNINTEEWRRDDASQARMQEEIQKLQFFTQLFAQSRSKEGGTGLPTNQIGGDTSTAGQINQQVNPATGLTVNQ